MNLEEKTDDEKKIQTRYSPRELLIVHLIYPESGMLDDVTYMEAMMSPLDKYSLTGKI